MSEGFLILGERRAVLVLRSYCGLWIVGSRENTSRPPLALRLIKAKPLLKDTSVQNDLFCDLVTRMQVKGGPRLFRPLSLV